MAHKLALGKPEQKVRDLNNEALEDNRTHKVLEESYRFDEMISYFSAEFINLPANEVDKKFEKWLQKFVEFLDIDRSKLFQFTDDHKEIHVTHAWVKKGVKNFPWRMISDDFPWCLDQLLNGKMFVLNKVDDLPPKANRDKQTFLSMPSVVSKSMVAIPLIVGGSVIGAISFDLVSSEKKWSESLIKRFRLIGEIFANAIARKIEDHKLKEAYSEIKQLKERLEAENIYLRDEIKVKYDHAEIVGKSDAIKKALSQVEQVATTSSTVLILGETGTGKELIANAIHDLSPRKNRTMVKINCAALPAALVESELFGREKGAYTGALSKQVGRFEIADGSTILFDEISEMPLELQAKLLRVLQDGEFEPLGTCKTIKVDVRIVAATNQDLDKAVREGRFREDLYYRLKVFPIIVPPLRDRLEDIPLLVWTFISQFQETMGKRIDTVPRRSMEAMQRYPWPGNIRELRNMVEHAMIISKNKTLHIKIPSISGAVNSNDQKLEDVERMHILNVLEKTGWRIRSKNGAAEILGLQPSTLYSRMKKLGVKRPDKTYDISTLHRHIDG
ncbi:MAG: sigma 54-interacting transcriptional regulator [Deltaproteobacteria bacterium]|nr:sigma 54-interacting transcriptional regulator [Deltaproteobacteria bacterium]